MRLVDGCVIAKRNSQAGVTSLSHRILFAGSRIVHHVIELLVLGNLNSLLPGSVHACGTTARRKWFVRISPTAQPLRQACAADQTRVITSTARTCPGADHRPLYRTWDRFRLRRAGLGLAWPDYGLLETVLVNLLVKVVRVNECALQKPIGVQPKQRWRTSASHFSGRVDESPDGRRSQLVRGRSRSFVLLVSYLFPVCSPCKPGSPLGPPRSCRIHSHRHARHPPCHAPSLPQPPRSPLPPRPPARGAGRFSNKHGLANNRMLKMRWQPSGTKWALKKPGQNGSIPCNCHARLMDALS